ncbi:MAG: hypothetical protein NT166_16535 [Candidatus Aminicenantes bacterium]|nr:hypothetical protein [Candidatus Aminicenantes bacterium]
MGWQIIGEQAASVPYALRWLRKITCASPFLSFLPTLYLVHSERELKKGYAHLALEPFLAQYPGLKFSYLIEIKFSKSHLKKVALIFSGTRLISHSEV